MNDSETLSRVERLERARAVQVKEADYRRQKRWQIFSWASSLLLGSLAGVVAISASRAESLPLIPHKLALIAAVVVLAAYAIIWIAFNGKKLDTAWGNVERIERELGYYDGIDDIEDPFPDELARFRFVSYSATIILIALASVTIILLS